MFFYSYQTHTNIEKCLSREVKNFFMSKILVSAAFNIIWKKKQQFQINFTHDSTYTHKFGPLKFKNTSVKWNFIKEQFHSILCTFTVEWKVLNLFGCYVLKFHLFVDSVQ